MDEPKHTVAFDEAGNTGQNLTDSNQPVFVHGTTVLPESVCEKLVKQVVTGDGVECHFVRLRRSSPGRKKILRLLGEDELKPSLCRASLYLKEFMIVAKIVDILVEPLMTRNGEDIYRSQFNVALSNAIFIGMRGFIEAECRSECYNSFVNMVRNTDETSIARFYESVNKARLACPNSQFIDILKMVLDTRQIVSSELPMPDKAALDPAIASFVHVATGWSESLNEEFYIIHDASKMVEGYRKYLLTLMDQSMEPTVVGYAPRNHILPIKGVNLEFKDSDSCYQLQVADVLAGSVYQWALGLVSGAARDNFWRELNKLDMKRFVSDTLWPDPDFVSNLSNQSLDRGVNPADAMAEYLRRQARAK